MNSGKPSVTALKDCIRFEDAHLIVLSKPAGWLSQEADHSKEPSVVSILQEYLGRPYVGLVHRLDRNTSGLMVVAKRTKSAQRLTDELRSGKLVRTYLAFLTGKVSSPATWKDKLKKNEKTKKTEVSKTDGKEAVLFIHPAGHGEFEKTLFTLARLELDTGRFHQIRAQAHARGHGLLGDTKYSATGVKTSLERPALHSHTLKFIHPTLKTVLEFVEPLPKDLQHLEKLTRFVSK